jgi:hypothetical protein
MRQSTDAGDSKEQKITDVFPFAISENRPGLITRIHRWVVDIACTPSASLLLFLAAAMIAF